MTDAEQNIVWQASYSPFGLANISVESVENNIRFPGQYYDAETELHYNYFRYYDVEIGRYATSDPIGLAGGINTYGYVGGNPLNYSDFFGLDFDYSDSAAPYIKKLRQESSLAGMIINAMIADTNTLYYVGVGWVPESSGGGETTLYHPSYSYSSIWDRIRRKNVIKSKARVRMRASLTPKDIFTDTCEKPFLPSTVRLLAHELGHGYTYLLGGAIGYRANYDDAIQYENKIAQELNLNAPTRTINDHGRFNFLGM